MDTKVNYTLVGAFVLILLSAMVISIIWLSSDFSFENYSTYLVYMQESVTGLDINSPVEYNGVNVGTVKSVALNHHNPQLVELLLNIRNDAPITRGTAATLNSRGITGITYIALKDKSTDLRPLKAEPGQPYPIIQTAPSLFLRLDTALNNLTNNVNKMTEAVQSVLDKGNQQAIKDSLMNLRQITNSLIENSRKLSIILENTSKASVQFAPLIQSSLGMMRMLETQTLPATYRMLANLDDVTRTLTEVTAEIQKNPSILIRGVDRQTLGPGETK